MADDRLQAQYFKEYSHYLLVKLSHERERAKKATSYLASSPNDRSAALSRLRAQSRPLHLIGYPYHMTADDRKAYSPHFISRFVELHLSCMNEFSHLQYLVFAAYTI